MNSKKALLVYGTRWGGTIDIAKRIGNILREEKFNVDIADAQKSQPDINPYDLIVIGSGVSMGNWTKDTQRFLKKNASKLRIKKTACFVSCGLVLRENGQMKAQEDYLVKVLKKYDIKPICLGTFGGILDFDKNHGFFGNIFVKSSMKRLQEMKIDITKPYDFRNWSEIETWARMVARTKL